MFQQKPSEFRALRNHPFNTTNCRLKKTVKLTNSLIMIHSVLICAFLIATISAQPSSFTNMPGHKNTKFRGGIACGDQVSGVPSKELHHSWKLVGLQDKCEISTTINSKDLGGGVITVYDANGRKLGNTKAKFTAGAKNSPFYIQLRGVKHPYKFSLSCSKKCASNAMMVEGNMDDEDDLLGNFEDGPG
eukprot:915696_1